MLFRYLGRKRLNRKDEVLLEGTESLVWPSYSYWTLSYLLSGRGARKLLAQEPLQKLLPVDEYLPVMFNKHPELVSDHRSVKTGLNSCTLRVIPD
ncbi:hypothetical protein DPMN_145478 [Dreissena polymorpha]|uniref:Uncharacterized protein n=1 Tax=Dreissena polymorpha TaxID=45954 RepID=A0A9D4J135_DREPO|nr:hypothetical protein DPMN_145478 [Dreissena polymorpha]